MTIKDLKNRVFKGSYFDDWFYADSIEGSEQLGDSYSYVFFKIDENTLIAFGCDPLSPKEFIEMNKENPFRVDESKEIVRRGKFIIYFARRYNSIFDDDRISSNLHGINKEFEILDVWSEPINNTGLSTIFARVSDFHHSTSKTYRIKKGLKASDSIVVMLEDSDSPHFLERYIGTTYSLRMEYFLVGNYSLKGKTLKAYYDKSYLIEEAKRQNFNFQFQRKLELSDFKAGNIMSEFEIGIKKSNNQIIGCPKDGDYSLAMIDSYFNEIESFINEELVYSSDMFKSKDCGLMYLKVKFQKEPVQIFVSEFTSFGFSIDELQKIIHEMRENIFK